MTQVGMAIKNQKIVLIALNQWLNVAKIAKQLDN